MKRYTLLLMLVILGGFTVIGCNILVERDAPAPVIVPIQAPTPVVNPQPAAPQPVATPVVETPVPTVSNPQPPASPDFEAKECPPCHTLTILIEPVDSGRVEIGGSEVVPGVATPIRKNDTIRVIARALEGFEFVRWERDLSGPFASEALRMNSDKVVVALFRAVTPEPAASIPNPVDVGTSTDADSSQGMVELIVLIDPPDAGYVEGAGVIVGRATSFNKGDKITLTARASDGWEFSRWKRDLESPIASEIVQLDDDMTILAVFVPVSANTGPTGGSGAVQEGMAELTVLIDPPDSGRVEIGGSEITPGVATPLRLGDSIRLIARPLEGFEFSRWERGIVSPIASEALYMDENKVVVAVFVKTNP